MTVSKKRIIIIGLLFIAIASGIFLLNRHESSASRQSTKDAYIQADYTYVAPQVSGTIAEVFVTDYQAVNAGDLLATINDEDFMIDVERAITQVNRAIAVIEGLQAQLQQQALVIRQSQASLAASEAALELAELNDIRYRTVATTGSGSVQNWQRAEAETKIALSDVNRAQAILESAKLQERVFAAEINRAEADLAQADANLEAAERNLAYTRIVAPIDGVIDQRSVRVGAFVNVGTPLLAIVPLNEIYILANYRETQLANIKKGDTVVITVDAFPGMALEGYVERLSPASGVSYAAIAPRNATGNFTKIVQRLPIRINFLPDQALLDQLKVGMSVQPTVVTQLEKKR